MSPLPLGGDDARWGVGRWLQGETKPPTLTLPCRQSPTWRDWPPVLKWGYVGSAEEIFTF